MTPDRAQHGGAPLSSQGDGRGFWERGLHLIAISIHRFEELNPHARRRIVTALVFLALGVLGTVALFLFAI
jgi:hypothetical protein